MVGADEARGCDWLTEDLALDLNLLGLANLGAEVLCSLFSVFLDEVSPLNLDLCLVNVLLSTVAFTSSLLSVLSSVSSLTLFRLLN